MKPLHHNEIFGNWATLLLPVREDDSIDYQKLEQEIDLLIAMQVNGIYSNGTAGEFYNQKEDEFDTINALLAEKCEAAGMPFQVGCSHPVPVITLDRVRRAIAYRPGAIQVILPDWSAPNMDEVISYLQTLYEVAYPVGLVLYNPPHAKKRLTPEEFYTIKEAGIGLVGCKVGGGDEQWYAAMRRLVPELSLFVPGHQLATGIQQGAHGAYSNVACLHPLVAQQWYEMMQTDIKKALQLQTRIHVFMNEYIVPFIREDGYSNQAADKLLAAIGGWCHIGTRLRWPYKGIDEADVLALREICRELLPEFFPEILVHKKETIQ